MALNRNNRLTQYANSIIEHSQLSSKAALTDEMQALKAKTDKINANCIGKENRRLDRFMWGH